MTDSLLIRDAIPADLPATLDIYTGYVTDSVATFEEVPPDAHEWEILFRSIVDGGLPFLVAELPAGGEGDEPTIIGYAYCRPWKTRPAYRYTAENSIYLAPSAAGHGYGRALLEALLIRGAEAGLREVIAVITRSAPASVALHRRCGFVERGTLTNVGYKHDQWLDTVLMQCSLRAEKAGEPVTGAQ